MALAEVVAYLLLSTVYTTFVSASSLPNFDRTTLDARALPNSPSGGYAPKVVQCPATQPAIRSAGSGLSQGEKDWLNQRRSAILQPMVEFMTRANIQGFDAASYLNNQNKNVSALPNIAIAISGGGYRALMNGAGFIAAADDRTAGTTEQGGIGGLLQSTTYLAGLSGGGWLVGSIYGNNFSSVTSLRDGSQGSSVWKFDRSIFEGPDKSGISILNTASYWDDIADKVDQKGNAGFERSVTDYWGRALSYQLINATDGGPAYTFSSIAQDANLMAGRTPMPILLTDVRDPGVKILSLNATNVEINPWETGSFDPTIYGFAPTQYLASNFSSGVIAANGNCVEGFDQIGYVMGTSSSLFNEFLTANLSQYANIPSVVASAIEQVLSLIGNGNNDIAQWVPNPFFGYNNATNPTSSNNQLSLVDGGEDLQNIPFTPLVQPVRAVDVIFAVDNSADTEFNWPNGTALRATYQRSLSKMANGTLFPAIPDEHTFVNLGLNNRPTFFGCDARNFTLGPGQTAPPLVVYVPNAPYTVASNLSTFDPSYALSQRDDVITNGLNAATQGNASASLGAATWPACVACAALSRSFARTGTAVPAGCQTCFQQYCWNGTLDAVDRGAYTPAYKLGANAGQLVGTTGESLAAARFDVFGRDGIAGKLEMATAVVLAAALPMIL